MKILSNFQFLDYYLFPPILMIHHCCTGGAEDGGESSGSLQIHQAPRVPEGRSEGALQRGGDQRYRPCH